jgi:beta-galactosidase/beta-glucuronidase
MAEDLLLAMIKSNHNAEEILQLADKRGIAVIDELLAVGMNFWHPHK